MPNHTLFIVSFYKKAPFSRPFNKFLQLHRWKIYQKTLTIKLCHYKGVLYERDPHPNKIIQSE